MAEWRVRLHGEDIDLSSLVSALTDPGLQVLEDHGEHYLRGTALEGFTEAEKVLAYVDDVLPVINGAAKVHFGDGEPVRSDTVYRVHDDGRRDAFVVLSGVIKARSRVTGVASVVGRSASPPPQPGATIASRVEVARRHREVDLALRLFAAESNWFNLYRVWEIIKRDVHLAQIESQGWCTRDQHERFTFSANEFRASGIHARHADRSPTKKPDPAPITMQEGHDFIRALLDRWIRTK